MENIELSNEKWKEIECYPEYSISNTGKVKSIQRIIVGFNGVTKSIKECILKPVLDSDGYKVFSITISQPGCRRKQKLLKVHREVAKLFISNPENKPQVNHINGIKTDNRIENLEWVTSRENMLHAYRTGLNKGAVGELARNAKITKEIVFEIRGIGKDLKLTEIGSIYGLSFQTISDIINRKTWKHI